MQLLPARSQIGPPAGPRHILAMAVGTVCLLAACTSGPPAPLASRYFSCTTYFQAEAKRLAQEYPEFRKAVTRNGMHDSSLSTTPDWSRELEPFVQCDIGKPSLAAAYRADTVIRNDTLRTRYTAREPSAPVRQIAVLSAAGRVAQIHIETGDTNALFTTRRRLDYRPGEGYDIEGIQTMKLGETTTYSVQARWQ